MMRIIAVGWLIGCLVALMPAQVMVQPEVADLIQQGNRARQQEQAQEALARYQLALERARTLGDKGGEASALHALGVALIDLGKPHEAVASLQQALSLWQSLNDSRGEATAWRSLGVAYTNLGNAQEALSAYQNALRLNRSLKLRYEEAHTLQGIGLVYYALYDTTSALRMMRDALNIWRELDDKPRQAECLRYIGNLLHATGQWQGALSAYEQVLAVCKESPNPETEALALSGIASLYLSMGQPELALNYYLQALELRLKDPLRKEVVVAYLGVGNLYRTLNDSAKARDYFQRALEHSRTLRYVRGEISALTALANLDANDQPQSAEKQYLQALTLARAHSDRQSQANIHTNLGLLHIRANRYSEALSALETARTLYAEIGDLNGEMIALSNQGTAYVKIGERRKALECYQQAIERAERLREQTSPLSEGRIAFQAQRQGLYATCIYLLVQEGGLESAFELAQRSKARTLNELLASGRTSIKLSEEERQQERALRFRLDRANQNLLAVRAVANPDNPDDKALIDLFSQEARQAELDLQAFYDRLYARYPHLATQSGARTATLQEIAQSLPSDAVLLEYVHLTRTTEGGSALMLFCLSNEQGKPHLTAHPIFTEGQPLAELTESFVLTCAVPNGDYAELSNRLERILLEPARTRWAEKRLLIICPDVELWDVPFQAIQTNRGFLGEHYTIAYAPSATIAIAMRSQELAQARPRPTESMLVVANPDFGRLSLAFLEQSRPLTVGSRPLLKGSRPLVKGSRPIMVGSRLITVGARPITVGARLLTTGARPLTTGARPLTIGARPLTIGARPITIGARLLTTGARPLTTGARPLTTGARPLTTGARDVAGTYLIGSSLSVSPLPHTQKEAETIRALFMNATILTGREAQEKTLKERMSHYRYIHLATHGYFSMVTPLQSGLLLAQPDADSEEDGLLTARELMEIPLSAEMVVLSACESGRGAARPGEGTMGMIWVLCSAGVPTQVLSQWKVSDESTARLMGEFYKQIANGKSPSEALRSASLTLKQMPEYAHPYYWAPFICVGGW